MSKLDDKLTYFKEWQAKIVELDKATGIKLKEMQKDYEEKASATSKELQGEIEKYKAEFKATFGLCDGEVSTTFNLIEAIRAVNLLQ